MIERVIATEAALALIREISAKHGALMFHQSGGCCDGSAPMCYTRGELQVGAHDVLLGALDGHPFYMSQAQFEYWQHTQLLIDAIDGNGGMFSLECGTGRRLLTRSRLYEDAELDQLAPVVAAA